MSERFKFIVYVDAETEEQAELVMEEALAGPVNTIHDFPYAVQYESLPPWVTL